MKLVFNCKRLILNQSSVIKGKTYFRSFYKKMGLITPMNYNYELNLSFNQAYQPSLKYRSSAIVLQMFVVDGFFSKIDSRGQ